MRRPRPRLEEQEAATRLSKEGGAARVTKPSLEPRPAISWSLKAGEVQPTYNVDDCYHINPYVNI